MGVCVCRAGVTWIWGGSWGVTGDDSNEGLVMVPRSVLWIPWINVVPAWSGSPRIGTGGGIVDGPGSFLGGCPLRKPPKLSGSSSLLLVKYCFRASFQLRPYQQ